jgi:hypothetical protein
VRFHRAGLLGGGQLLRGLPVRRRRDPHALRRRFELHLHGGHRWIS